MTRCSGSLPGHTRPHHVVDQLSGSTEPHTSRHHAEILTDIESDPDDLTRLRLIGALREVLA